MKTTGITRRIDELGRIVIPKEIRKNMHLKTGELLEIFLNDDTIMLKKFSLINKKEEFLDYYINLLAKKTHTNIYITSLNEVVFSNDKKFLNTKITNELQNIIRAGNNTNNLTSIKLSNDVILSGDLSIFTLSPNADLVGFMIIQFKENNKDEIFNIINFSKSLIENYLESN